MEQQHQFEKRVVDGREYLVARKSEYPTGNCELEGMDEYAGTQLNGKWYFVKVKDFVPNERGWLVPAPPTVDDCLKYVGEDETGDEVYFLRVEDKQIRDAFQAEANEDWEQDRDNPLFRDIYEPSAARELIEVIHFEEVTYADKNGKLSSKLNIYINPKIPQRMLLQSILNPDIVVGTETRLQ